MREQAADDENEDPNEGSHCDLSSVNEEQISKKYPRFDTNFCTPPPKTRIHRELSFDAEPCRVRDQIRGTPTGARLQSEEQSEDEADWTVNYSDIPECDSEDFEREALSSSLWSPIRSQYSSRTSLHSEEFQQEDGIYMDGDDDDNFSSPMRQENFVPMSMEEPPMDERDYLPRSIVFGLHEPKGIISTAYGDLFQQEDPWNTIGVILGLPQADTVKTLAGKPRVDLSVESTSQMDVDDRSSKFDEFYERCEGKFPDECHEDDMDCEPEVRMTGLIQDRTLPDDLQASRRYADRSGDQIIPERSLTIHEDDFDAVDSEEETAENKIAAIVESSAHHDAEYAEIITDGKNVPTAAVQDMQYCEASREGNSEGRGQILDTPDLREVDGRFLGPSLFENFADSDDEFSD